MPPLGFEPTIPAGERLQTYALDRTATGTGSSVSGSDHDVTSRDVVIPLGHEED